MVAPLVLTATGLHLAPRVFTAGLGFSSWQRAIISHAGQSYTLEHGHGEQGDTLRIMTQDLRGTSELELPLSGRAVFANDGDNGARVCRSAVVKGSPPCMVVTESAPRTQKIPVCTRCYTAGVVPL